MSQSSRSTCRHCRRTAREVASLRRLLSDRLERIDSELDYMGTKLRDVERLAESVHLVTCELMSLADP